MPTSTTRASSALPIRLRGVGRHFGERPVLNDLDLDVEAGEIIAIVGPSGCGKSTLLRQVGGLDQPDSGTVDIDDSPTRPTDQRCAIAFQEPRLLPWRTLRQNVELGLPKARRRSERAEAGRRSTGSKPDKAAGRARITELLDLVGLGSSAGLRPRQVSGGMAQRTSLARALARAPKVLLLDEPFGALDALTRLRMHDLLLDIHRAEPTTVLLVTHDVDEALYLADRIVVLADLSQQQQPQLVGATGAADTTAGGAAHADTAGGAPSIRRIVTVPGDRPRDRDDPALAELRLQLLADLGVHRVHAGNSTTSTLTATATAGRARTETAPAPTPADHRTAPDSTETNR
ncbi:ABC transporter ATP-binding protein [Frigoribacterium sp. PhB118]|uniref:ABC transporter ATP-binding protein n=1 Tax=Frigoribacterium sp. PhB118 TaxID=2485175 RepID=UPI000F463093|nr:ABC transporter ATP-binding protein [Frigoribacterium sp. PhB118]ROS56388.1 sulfonate transport system ATP-binding protein [Frigoribacterium sp. PhB118]